MGNKVAHIGSPISHGGAVVEGSENVNVNGIPVARVGDKVICDLHFTQLVASGSATVSANGKAVARVGDTVSCGATILDGSPNTFAGG